MKLIVHLHVYYTDQVDQFIRWMQNITHPFALYVTLVQDDQDVRRAIVDFKADAIILVVPNLGYDIAPFLFVLDKLSLDPDVYLLKLHTKGTYLDRRVLINKCRMNYVKWGETLVDSLLHDAGTFQKNLALLLDDQTIGMVAADGCITPERRHVRKLMPMIRGEILRIGFPMPRAWSFVAGTTFLARAELFRPLQKVYTAADFDQSSSSIRDGLLAHGVERIFGALVYAQHQRIAACCRNALPWPNRHWRALQQLRSIFWERYVR